MVKKDYSYGWQKLYSAIGCLTGQGLQTERLINAVFSLHVLIARPKEKYLPPDVQVEFEEFWREITTVEGVSDITNIRDRINVLSEIEVQQTIERIIYFYDTVCRYRRP
jgi:hypothetical protein